MTRWAACLQYRGGAYNGWQRQPHQPSVQGAVERALSKVAATPTTVHCAGRTDAGVHALAQVISFDSDAGRPQRAWLLGGNSLLPADISLAWVQSVPESFHARFSARGRRYRYVVWNAPVRSAPAAHATAWVRPPLNETLMNVAAQALLGEQDFSAFRAAQCQSRTPMRCVFEVRVWRTGCFVVMDIHANAFLQHMVRNIMGSLIEIGQGRQPTRWMAELLRGRDRRLAAATAPPTGLHFLGPDYSPQFQLPPLPEPWFP